MVRARKAHGDKVILDDVTLAFLPGAKIGVVGPNGAGKSSVLKIMAGLDHPSNGDALLAPGYSVGLLQQEPSLNEAKDVRGNVEEAVEETRSLLQRGRAYPYEGNYSTYLEKKAERVAVTGRKDAKLKRRLEDELAWVRQNAKGRQSKQKARLLRYDEMATEAEKTRKLDFEEIQIPPGPRLGSVVVEARDLTKGVGDRVLIDDLSFTLPCRGTGRPIEPYAAENTRM